MEKSKMYINENGSKVWYLPSIGTHYWHRIDGPAFQRFDGTNFWWIYDVQLPTAEVEAWIKENNIDLKTIEGQMAFRLRWT